MLFGADERPGVSAGLTTLVHRRWRSQLVYAGRTYRTNVSRIGTDEVTELAAAEITDVDAIRAGKADAQAVRGDPEWPVFRIAFQLAEDPDPRSELAARAEMDADELAELNDRLARLDRVSAGGAWTRATLEVIAAEPATRAADLATEIGRETASFKLVLPQPSRGQAPPGRSHVRKLKNLGLTYSLEVGYRLAPRVAAYLRWLS